MPQPTILTEKLGKYTVTAIATGYTIVTDTGETIVEQKDKVVHKSKTEGVFITEQTHCVKTNMQRAMLIAQQLMEIDSKKGI